VFSTGSTPWPTLPIQRFRRRSAASATARRLILALLRASHRPAKSRSGDVPPAGSAWIGRGCSTTCDSTSTGLARRRPPLRDLVQRDYLPVICDIQGSDPLTSSGVLDAPPFSGLQLLPVRTAVRRMIRVPSCYA